MSTKSMIGIVREDGKIDCIYCHNDGYLNWVGKILKEHYHDKEKVTALINLGDISSLDKSIECPPGHTFDSPIDGYTIAYGRDRGEKNVQFKTVDDKQSFLKRAENMGCNYFYLYDNDKWTTYLNNKWKDLDKVMK